MCGNTMPEAERFILKNGNFEMTYIIGERVLNHIPEYTHENQKAIFIVSSRIDQKYHDYISEFSDSGQGVIKFIVSDGENLKNIKNYQKIMSIMLQEQIEKSSLLGYIGGGTVGDMAGFVAATYKRGMKFMAIPTTLLSQVDSSIGGKNGINYGGIKNVIGTFYDPSVVMADTHFLTASEDSNMKDGLCEVIKYAIIEKSDLFSIISRFHDISELKNREALIQIISKSVKIKHGIISKDYYDRVGIRAKLNFGHTVGHAIEAISKSGISHGKAIATGMLIESIISRKMGLAEEDVYSAIIEFMNRFGIKPVSMCSYNKEILLKFIRNDKKISENNIYMSLPVKIGEVVLTAVTPDIISDALREFNGKI